MLIHTRRLIRSSKVSELYTKQGKTEENHKSRLQKWMNFAWSKHKSLVESKMKLHLIKKRQQPDTGWPNLKFPPDPHPTNRHKGSTANDFAVANLMANACRDQVARFPDENICMHV